MIPSGPPALRVPLKRSCWSHLFNSPDQGSTHIRGLERSPAALLRTRCLGFIRFAECFQVILSLLLDKNLHTTFGARRLFGASFAVLLSDHYDDVFTQFYQTDIY